MMNQCVPSWALNQPSSSPKFSLPVNSDAASTAPSFDPMLDYEVAELTWENGHIVMHGLGPPRTVLGKLPTKGTWEKPRANGTLESIVSQATKLTSNMKQPQTTGTSAAADLLVPWFSDSRGGLDSVTMTLDALVPGTCGNGSSTRVDSYSGVGIAPVDNGREEIKRARVAVVPVAACEGSSKNYSSVNRVGGGESAQVGVDTEEIEVGTGFTSTSLSLPLDSHMTPMAVDERVSASHSGTQEKEEGRSNRKGKLEEEKDNKQKSSVPTKRSRAAAVHNQSERKRRDKINQKMKTLQKLVPNSSKTDKASMLDEVIEYLKQLQAQVQMMSRMGIPNMMMSMTMQQQLQMSMMAQMGFMGMMDQMNPMARPGGFATIPPQVLNPAAFLPSLPSWDGAAGSDHRLPSVPTGTILPDPFSSFLASQQQPLNMEAYNKMAALYHQQLHSQPSGSGAKS